MLGVQVEPYQKFAREKLGFEYQNIDLLITALTHRSYVNEHKKSTMHHNERLEFLGDAVLEIVTTDYLFRTYPKEPEGILTSWRAALVRTESIGEAGRELGYEPLVRMSRGEKHDTTHARDHILANAFEAVLGSVYLEKGYEAASQLVHKYIIAKLPAVLEDESWRDPKSYLQEVVQRKDNQTPKYKVLSEEGPDHDKTFTVGVFVNNKKVGDGTGSSKQAAQQESARAALRVYKAQAATEKPVA